MRSAQAAYALACGVAPTAHVDVTTFDRRRSNEPVFGPVGAERCALPTFRRGAGVRRAPVTQRDVVQRTNVLQIAHDLGRGPGAPAASE